MNLDIIEVLKRNELFLGLDDDAIRKIADLPSCQMKAYEAREAIFKAGEEAKHLHVVSEGKVNLVFKTHASSSQPLAQALFRTITKGGVFGWSALVPPYFRMTSTFSEEPSKIVSISGDELRVLFNRDHKLGYEVMQNLLKVVGSRVWNIEQLLLTGKRSPFIW